MNLKNELNVAVFIDNENIIHCLINEGKGKRYDLDIMLEKRNI